MKLAVSNIAWAPHQRLDAYAAMAAHGAAGLELAPGLTFPDEADPFAPSPASLAAFRAELAGFGLVPVSAQSLLFGVADAQLFGSPEQQARFAEGMDRAIGFAARVGVPNLVFGSPACRAYGSGWTAPQALDHAAAVFRQIGARAADAGTRVAIEPNAAVYGTNFLNTLPEAAAFVRAVGHPAITLNFDLGALIDAADPIEAVVADAGPLASHVHISAPGLAPAPASAAELAPIVAGLRAEGYAGWYSIEMRPPPGDWRAGLTRSLVAARDALSAKESGHA